MGMCVHLMFFCFLLLSMHVSHCVVVLVSEYIGVNVKNAPIELLLCLKVLCV